VAKQQGPHVNRNGNTWSFVNAAMIPRPTLSNVPAASSVLGSARNLEDGNATTNVSINDNDNDELSEGGSDERQVKKNLGTKRKIKFQDEALNLETRKSKLMEERLMKKSQAEEDEDCMFLTSLLRPLKKWTHSKTGNQNRISEQRNQENSNC
jgi:hypothetical protein